MCHDETHRIKGVPRCLRKAWSPLWSKTRSEVATGERRQETVETVEET